MGQKVNIAVIGLGVMGTRHVYTCSNHPETNLVAVCDVRKDVTKAISEKFHVPGYINCSEMLDCEKLDAVVVATSDQFHRQPCEESARRGVHIFLEKPIAICSSEGEAILKAVKVNNVKLMVGHTLRYDPRYAAVADMVNSGKLGDINHFYTRRNATVNSGRRIEGRAEVMVFQGVHDLDYINWIIKSRVTRVYAEANYKELSDLNVADTIVATMRFENGAVGLIEQSWGLPANLPSPLDAQLEIIGSKGAAYLEMRAQSLSVFTDGVYSQPDIIYNLSEQHYLIDEFNQFVGYLRSEKEPKISGEEALAALKVAEAIVQSMRQSIPVNL